MERHISYWLVPAEPFYHDLQRLIRSISEERGSACFEPHVTVFSGPGSEKDGAHITQKAARLTGPIELRVKRVDHRPLFTKTIFVELEMSPPLLALSEQLRCFSGKESDFLLKPHLSLVYSNIEARLRQELAAKIEMNRETISFDRLKTISTPVDLRSKEDIALWKNLGSICLR